MSLIQKAAQQLSTAGQPTPVVSTPAPARGPLVAPLPQAQMQPHPVHAAPTAPRRPAAPDHHVPQPALPSRGTAWQLPDQQLGDAGQITPSTQRTRLAEEVRVAARRILRKWSEPANEGKVSRSLLVTSAEPGEGKSFSALNLAMSCALEGIATTLIDGDLLQRGLSDRLQAADRPGLTDHLRDPGRPLDAFLLRDPRFPALAILSAGTPLGGIDDLPRGDAIRDLLLAAERRQPDGIVIIDTPPVLSSSVAGLMADSVGTVLLVVKANSTPDSAVQAALDLLEAAGDVGLLLNRTAAFAAEHRFGTYGQDI